MSEVELQKWEDNAKVVLSWSEEDDVIQAVVTSNQRIMFSVPIDAIQQLRLYQTILNDMVLGIKIDGIEHKFIALREVPLLFGTAYIAGITLFSIKNGEKQLGLDKLTFLLEQRRIPVKRHAYARLVALTTFTSLTLIVFGAVVYATLMGLY